MNEEQFADIEQSNVAFNQMLIEHCEQGGFLFGLDDQANAPSVERWMGISVATSDTQIGIGGGVKA